MLTIKVDENIAGQRLDRFVRKFLNDASLGFIYRMIRRGNIEINGKKSPKDKILKLNDEIKFWMSDDTINKFRTVDDYKNNIRIDLDILYEDQNIIAINKPAGLLSHDDGTTPKNLVDGLINYLIDRNEYNPKDNPTFKPSIANRLDKNTSGIVIGCKTYNSLREINRTLRERKTRRFYNAVVLGKLIGQGVLEDKLIFEDNKAHVNKYEGKDITTKYECIKSTEELSLLEVEIISGRTHQIRAHLSYIDHPILGDPKYGNQKINQVFKVKSQMLHCNKVIFDGLYGDLEYLNGLKINSPAPRRFLEIVEKG